MAAQDTWTISVRRREFVKVAELPYWSRKLVGDPTKKPQGLGKGGIKIAKSVHSLLYRRLGLNSTGRLELGADSISVPINGGHSVYIDFASRSQFGGYEPVESALLDRLLPKSMAFYDIGCNWDYYTLLARTNNQFRGEVFAFDVVDAMLDEVENTLTAANLDRVHVMRFGLSDRSGQVLISREEHAHLSRVLEKESSRGRRAEVRRLDDLDIEPADLIKMDVEDHEHAVLAGGTRLIREHRPAILFESRVVGKEASHKPAAFLAENGYALFAINFSNPHGTEITLRKSDMCSAYLDTTAAMNFLALPENEVERWLT